MCTKYWLTACSSLPRKKNWIHDIWSKTISSKQRLVECDIWSTRRFVDYVIWLNMTIGRKFVEINRNSSKFGRKLTCTEKMCILPPNRVSILTAPIRFHACTSSCCFFVFRILKSLIHMPFFRAHLLPIKMMVYPF